MKISPTKYPVADPKIHLVFDHPDQMGISLVFAQRLAAFAASKKKKLYLTSGYRSVAYQKALYDQNCKEHPPHGNGFVAKPGSSWHNGRCAVDIEDRAFWKNYIEKGDMLKPIKQQELAKFGLALPLNRKDAYSVFEWWHIQPIETIGFTGDRTKFLTPEDKLYGVVKK